MNSRERCLAALRMQPADRLPFWPKIDDAYLKNQTPEIRAKPLADLLEWIGSDRHFWVNSGVTERRTSTAVKYTREGDEQLVEYSTPRGTLRSNQLWDATSGSWHPVSFPVRSLEDIRIMTAWYEDRHVEPDAAAVAKAAERVSQSGGTALVETSIGTSPLMTFVEWLAGVEQAHYLLADHPGEIEELFAAMHRALLRATEIASAKSPADLFYFIENTSTTLISPEQYRRYCLPHLAEYARLGQQAGKLIGLHMCGHLKAILPDLAKLPVAAFEAFTSPTVGNTTLLDGRRACPATCLIGGTNAALWLRPAGAIIAQIEADLKALPHHRGLIVTSSGVMPPACAPATIRSVCEWVKQYPACW